MKQPQPLLTSILLLKFTTLDTTFKGKAWTVCVLLVSGLVHLAECSGFMSVKVHSGGCMYQNVLPFMAKCCSPAWVYYVLLIFSSIMDTWVVSVFWVLWWTLPWTRVYKCLFEVLLSVLTGLYLGLELLDRGVILCLTFWGMTWNFITYFMEPSISKKGPFQCVINIKIINEQFCFTFLRSLHFNVMCGVWALCGWRNHPSCGSKCLVHSGCLIWRGVDIVSCCQEQIPVNSNNDSNSDGRLTVHKALYSWILQTTL